MEFASIEREITIAASPEVVYEVVSRPEHLRAWWPDDVALEPVAGADGHVVFGDPDDPDHVVQVRVVAADPPRRFAFRWTHEAGQDPAVENSLLVTFDLEAAEDGTILHFVETGFRDRGWDDAEVASQYHEHVAGWDHFLPRLVDHAATVGASA